MVLMRVRAYFNKLIAGSRLIFGFKGKNILFWDKNVVEGAVYNYFCPIFIYN